MTKFVLRKADLPTTPTPSDPLANIDNTLITGGKDGIVSAREVESAGNRAALTPSPHRGEKHVGPGMWVHVNPDGGSTGRGSRVTGQDDPVPELHTDSHYSSPEQENNISQSTPPVPSLPNTHLRNADGRATQLANQGYDFANPHVAYNTTKKLLEHLHSRGRGEQANALQKKMDKEHRLSLYPWEIADEDPHFLDTYVPHYQGELRIDPEDEGYKRNQAGIQKSIARPRGLLSLPRREHEVDPVELRERKKRAKERAKQKRKNKFHPHRMRKDDDKRASFVDDDALNPDESDVIEPEHGEPDDGTAVRGSIRDKKTPKGIYIAKAAQTPVSVNQHVLGLSQESPVSLTHIDKRMGQGLLPPSQRKTNPFDADKRGGARLITAKSTYINGYPPNSTFYSHGNDHLAYLRGDFSNARRRSFNAHSRMPDVLTHLEKNAVYAGFTPSDEKKAVASNEVASDDRLYDGMEAGLTHHMEPNGFHETLARNDKSPLIDPEHPKHQEMLHRLRNEWANEAMPLTEYNQKFPNGHPEERLRNNEDPTWQTEILLPNTAKKGKYLYAAHPLMQKLGMIDHEGNILDHKISGAEYSEHLKNAINDHFNSRIMKSEDYEPVTSVHRVMDKEEQAKRNSRWNDNPLVYKSQHIIAMPLAQTSSIQKAKNPGIQPTRPDHLPELTKSSIWNSNPLVSSIVMTNPFGESEYRANKRKMGKSDTSIDAVGMHIPHAFDYSPSPQKVQRSLQSIATSGMTPQPKHLHGEPTKYYDETLNRGSHIYAQRAAEGLVKQGRGMGLHGEHTGEENHVYLGLTPDDEKKSSVADMYNYGPDYVDKHPLDEWNKYYHEIDPRHVSEKTFNEVMIPHHIPRERIILGRDVIKNLPVNYSHDDYIQVLHNHMLKQWGRGLPLKDMDMMKNLPYDDLKQWGKVYTGRRYPYGMNDNTQRMFQNYPRLESSFSKKKLLLKSNKLNKLSSPLALSKSGTKGSNSKKAQQDVRPSHVYKARDGHGYRNMNVVPVGTPHGSGTRQEFPDPSWRLDMNGNVSFSSRDFKRHIRHDHTILPVEDSEHGRHNLLMLHALSTHARSTADRNGDTNGFWDRLPTPEEVPFYPNDKGEHDVEAYQAIRSIQHGSEDAARRNSKHSNAAEGWRHYAKTVANAIEQHTGKHPEMHLLARDVEKITQIYTQAKSLGKELESYARMKTIPQPGVNFHLRCDRTLLPEKYREYLNAADESMHSNCLALGSLFTTSEAHDSRDVDFAKIQRRAWIQLAKDIEVSAAARTLTIPRLEDLVHTQWSDSTATHSGTPFYQLSQSHLSMNFSRMVPEKRQRIVERQLAMTFEKLLRSVNKAPSGHAPDEIRNKRVIDYLDKIRPVLTTNTHSFYTIASVGAFTPETIFDSSGLSHNSIADEQNISGMQRAVFLHDGSQMIPDDVTFVFHPSVYETKGAVGMPSSAVALDKKNHINLKNQLYRPTRTNRAILHMLTSLEPAVVAERWNDIVEPKFTHLHTQIIAIPEKLSLSDVSHIILHKDLPPDSVETIRKILQRDYRHIKVVQGTYEDIFS